jgi:hypothetical protein
MHASQHSVPQTVHSLGLRTTAKNDYNNIGKNIYLILHEQMGQ